MDAATNFRHLNLRNEWPGVTLSGLAIRPDGALTLAPVEPDRAAAGYTTVGSFVAGPISVGELDRRWHRLVVTADPLPPGAHLRIWTHVGPTEPDDWQPAPRDATDLLIPGAAGPSLWVRGDLHGDGTTTPVVHQLRVSYDHDGYLRHLPAIFRDAEPGGFLERALALMESLLGDAEATIDDLPRLFDPTAAPDTGSPSWLDWLATWLALPLSETWSADRRRSAIGEAFARHGRRGTVAALCQDIELYADATVTIDEPGRRVAVWSLGQTSVLGWDTVLAAAEPWGAVLGSTAVADRTHLIAEDDHGAPLFETAAHRFCVRLRAEDAARPETVARVRAVLDRAKPAHTVYDLCPVDDRMRVGVQLTVGVDAYVAGPPDPWVGGGPYRLGTQTVLAGTTGEDGTP